MLRNFKSKHSPVVSSLHYGVLLPSMDILFIEDEKEFATSLQKLLEFNYYSVDTASTGEQGLRLAKRKNYNLIILDVMLPGLDGFHVAQRIRQEGIATPIIMLTAREAVGDRVKGLDSGADDYLVKPFEFEELLARLRSVLRRQPQLPAQPSAKLLRIADLVLNPANYEVRRGGEIVALNNKEYEMLAYLVGRPGVAVSRKELGEQIWGKGRFKSNTIDVHIRYLRKKIDEDHKNQLIHTIRGRGYMVKEPASL